MRVGALLRGPLQPWRLYVQQYALGDVLQLRQQHVQQYALSAVLELWRQHVQHLKYLTALRAGFGKIRWGNQTCFSCPVVRRDWGYNMG